MTDPRVKWRVRTDAKQRAYTYSTGLLTKHFEGHLEDFFFEWARRIAPVPLTRDRALQELRR